MKIEKRVGVFTTGRGAEDAPLRGGVSGELIVGDAHGRYFETVREGNTFYLSTAAAAPTAYVGAAGGTPLFAIHNPINSGKILVLVGVGLALRAIATAAGQTGIIAWSGVSVIPTGTTTPPTNALSQVASGAVARGFVNAALTGSTALTIAMPLATHYWATAASAFFAPNFFDIGGMVVAMPGNQIAVGVTVVPTTLTVDGAIYWEEVQIP